MQNLLSQIQQQTSLEWIVVITGLIYVILAAREKSACWIFGIISAACWGYASYVYYDLFADALLQMYYVVMGFYGIYNWKFSKNESNNLSISSISGTNHLLIIGGGLGISAIFGYLFAAYTSAAATYIDSMTTIFSMVATFMTVQKKIDNWIYWIVVDILYVYLYFTRGALLFAVLMGIYTIIAVYGWINWKRQFNTNPRT